MSHSVNWIEPIYDRAYSDVLEAMDNPLLENPIGAYNASDLNRIENNTKYVMEDMLERKIIRVPPSLAIKLNWTENDIPTREDMTRLIGNVKLLMDLSNPIIKEDFLQIYESTQMTYTLANAIEYDLELMKNQPELPIKKWLLKVVNGIIVETNTSSEYLEEEQVVHIKAVPYGENARYMIFQHWSGNSEDLQYVGKADAEETTFKMVYHESEDYETILTAEFKVRFPRTLTLHGGRIYDEVGGTTRQFFAGDEILLLADVATPGKRFYEWLGTQEGLDNLTGGSEPSTSWLVMPDCDVELTSKYINAGQHSVTIDGKLDGWYDYDEYVSIYPESRGEKWSFSYWSGDTGYLEKVTDTSFKMPDVNVRFTSNWTYNYSYNTVTMINGLINGQVKQENLREGSGQSISANTAPEGYEFSHWSKEGLGSFSNANASNTTFYIGDGNAIITANYKKIPPSHTVTIENEGNNGGTRTFSVREGSTYSISSSEVLADYMFDHWDKDGSRYSSSHYVNSITMGTSDVRYTANYRTRNNYTLTVNNGSGSGTYKERQSVSISANTAQSGYQFSSWSGNYYSIGSRYSSSTSITMPSGNCTVTANYSKIPDTPTRIYHDLTVNNGSGSGRYYEGQSITCYGNQAPDTYEFSHWTEGNDIMSYANPYRFSMGTSDRTITANYKPIPYFDVTVINGKLADGNTTGTFIRNSNPTIIMDPAPEGMKFLQWEIVEGDQNDVYQPLSENTYIRNLTHNVTVKAKYYVPNPEITYTLTIEHKTGESEDNQYPVGEQVDIYADEPDEGYEFARWAGDTQYINDRYAEKAVVNMPAKNISVRMEYEEIGAVKKYHVILRGGELLTETDENGVETWAIEGDFEERTVVQIRAIDIPLGWKFNGWKNDTDGGKSVSTVNDLTDPTTFLTVENFVIDLTRDVIERDKFSITIVDGEVSGSYHESDPVAVYFNLENTETTHYNFIRWSGNDLAYIKLFNGGSFDVFEPGTGDNPQIIKMPTRNITIKATYDTTYRLKVTNGNIAGQPEGFFAKDTKVKVSANEPEQGKRFSHWTGNTNYVDNKFNPNITVTMPDGGIELVAVYVNENNRNDVYQSSNYLYDTTTVNASDITPISGNLEFGCLVIDNKGHLYVVNNIDNNVLTIVRLTKKQGGNENGE